MPIDSRTKYYHQNDSPYAKHYSEVDALKAELDKRRPLTQWEIQCLLEEFLINIPTTPT